MPAKCSTPAPFDTVRRNLEKQYADADYTPGWSKEELQAAFQDFCRKNPNEPHIIQKAQLLYLICQYAPIAREENDYFAGKVKHYNLLLNLRSKWRLAEAIKEFGKERLEYFIGDYTAQLDCNSHICPDWVTLLELGLKGIHDRSAALADTSDFHRAVKIAFAGVMILCRRFDAIHPAHNLAQLAERPPQTFIEALQLSFIYHELIELDGIQVRSMGLFDRLYNRFYLQDIANKTLTREQAAEILKYYWIKFFAKTEGKKFGKPFTFGPEANELTYLAFEAYGEMKIHDPKFHLKLSEKTPEKLLELACKVIRSGSNAVVLINSDLQEKMLVENGKTPEDAADYILIGCYEPAVQGKELNCSGAGHLSLVKPVEQVLQKASADWSYEDFEAAYFDQLEKNLALCIDDLKRWERLWPEAHPAPLLSGAMTCCYENDRDVSAAGAKYNTTGVCCGGLADAVDSLVAVRELLARKLVNNITDIALIMEQNWQGNELLRKTVMHKFPAWGNNNDEVDELAVRIANFAADRINTVPNARNGVFQMALYVILNTAQNFGSQLGALPNGRLAGTVLTLNTNCENAHDFNGATAILNSNAKLPMHRFPNGTTLDLTLHPSAVAHNKGIRTLMTLIRKYFEQGGAALQFNIFGKETLLEARKDPEKYANLQVRVCGWNLRFVDLAPEEQQIFIDRANGGDLC